MKTCRYCKRKFKPDGRQKITCGRKACQKTHAKQSYKKKYKAHSAQIKAEQLAIYKKHRKKILARMRRYYARPEVKTKQLEYLRKYYKRPAVKAKRQKRNKKYWKKYTKRPSVKKRRALVQRQYLAKPGILKKRRAYLKKYMRAYRLKIKKAKSQN